MWTSRNRARYDRSKLRYPSDVTDEEWELMDWENRNRKALAFLHLASIRLMLRKLWYRSSRPASLAEANGR